jgi:iron complex transport system substrate-binding protein
VVRLMLLALAFCALLHSEALRIVSTAPSSTETLYALGLGDRVAGVSQYCHYPPEARRKTNVGSYLRPNAETVLALRPDLVIVQKVPSSPKQVLARLGLNVLEVEHGNLATTLETMERIAAAAGVPERGRSLRQRIENELRRIADVTKTLPRRDVLFVVGREPGSLRGLIAVGSGSYLNELFSIAGARNAFEDAATPYPKISLEEVLSRNPDVILDMGDMADTAQVTPAQMRAVEALWARQPALRAVRERRVHAIASDIYVVPGPRVVDAALSFARMIHPEAGL